MQPWRLPAEGSLPSGDDVRQALGRVFARPEFRPEPPQGLDGFSGWLKTSLERFFHWLRDALSLSGAPASEVIFGTIVLIVAVAVASHLAWSVWRLRAPAADAGERPRRDSRSRDVAASGVALASSLAAAGRFAEAMHALYDGAVVWLDREGRVRHEHFKTGADYVAELDEAHGRSFRALLASYYPVEFGGRSAAQSDWQRMRNAATELGVPA